MADLAERDPEAFLARHRIAMVVYEDGSIWHPPEGAAIDDIAICQYFDIEWVVIR